MSSCFEKGVNLAFSLEETEYLKIEKLFLDYPKLLNQDFKNRIKKALEFYTLNIYGELVKKLEQLYQNIQTIIFLI